MFENFHYQAGNDQSGVPTDMLSLNSTVKISYRNPATFYAVHVTSTPWELYHFQLKIASGQVKLKPLFSPSNPCLWYQLVVKNEGLKMVVLVRLGKKHFWVKSLFGLAVSSLEKWENFIRRL